MKIRLLLREEDIEKNPVDLTERNSDLNSLLLSK